MNVARLLKASVGAAVIVGGASFIIPESTAGKDASFPAKVPAAQLYASSYDVDHVRRRLVPLFNHDLEDCTSYFDVSDVIVSLCDFQSFCSSTPK